MSLVMRAWRDPRTPCTLLQALSCDLEVAGRRASAHSGLLSLSADTLSPVALRFLRFLALAPRRVHGGALCIPVGRASRASRWALGVHESLPRAGTGAREPCVHHRLAAATSEFCSYREWPAAVHARRTRRACTLDNELLALIAKPASEHPTPTLASHPLLCCMYLATDQSRQHGPGTAVSIP